MSDSIGAGCHCVGLLRNALSYRLARIVIFNIGLER